VKHYRSSIPKSAEEHVLATHVSGPQKYMAEYTLDGVVVGMRNFDETGQLNYECPLKNGRAHGTRYFFDEGAVTSSEPYVNGLAHGTARQWSEDGQLIGTYRMRHGTGLDLWRCRRRGRTGKIYLSEARYFKDGMFHGFEWWLNEDQKSVHHERHFWKDQKHGIERSWNSEGRLERGYPKYWINDRQASKRQYLRERLKDRDLPPFREADNLPKRKLPQDVARHLEWNTRKLHTK
jgi:hypothetical protein